MDTDYNLLPTVFSVYTTSESPSSITTRFPILLSVCTLLERWNKLRTNCGIIISVSPNQHNIYIYIYIYIHMWWVVSGEWWVVTSHLFLCSLHCVVMRLRAGRVGGTVQSVCTNYTIYYCEFSLVKFYLCVRPTAQPAQWGNESGTLQER